MPKCTLYLSDDDNVVYQDLKKRGENPSAIFSKAIRVREQELNSKTVGMQPIPIFRGSSEDGSDTSCLEMIKFVGKELARGSIKYDPQYADGYYELFQVLYLTQKGNYLLYEISCHTEINNYGYQVIEKNKPIPPMEMAPEIQAVLGIQDDVGTFLDI